MAKQEYSPLSNVIEANNNELCVTQLDRALAEIKTEAKSGYTREVSSVTIFLIEQYFYLRLTFTFWFDQASIQTLHYNICNAYENVLLNCGEFFFTVTPLQI